MIKSGFAFHCHHDILMEYVTDYDKRVEDIKRDKPPEEQALRLRLFRLIPEDRLPIKLVEAWDAYDKAGDARDKAGDAWDKARDAWDKARDARDKAWDAYDKAWDAYDKAGDASRLEINKLHEELCPDCPFDGKTIFPVQEV